MNSNMRNNDLRESNHGSEEVIRDKIRIKKTLAKRHKQERKK